MGGAGMVVMGAEIVEQDWELVKSQLPAGWEQAGWDTRALRREQGPLSKPEVLLRVVLGRAASSKSYREVAAHARVQGLAAVSNVALFKRERQCADWLEWIADEMLKEAMAELPDSPLRLRLVDATCASKPGSTGTDFRLHVCVQVPERRFLQAELTDAKGGESFWRFRVEPGDLFVGDRAYSTASGIKHVVLEGGQVLVRVNTSSLPLFSADDVRIDPLRLARALRPGETIEVDVWVRPRDADPIAARLCIAALPKDEAEKAQRRLRREYKGARGPGQRALESAKYVFLVTTAPRHQLTLCQAFATYRFRWQIELAFKTLKSVLKLGDLPNRLPNTGRTWLLGKLVSALIVDRLSQPPAQAIPPGAVA